MPVKWLYVLRDGTLQPAALKNGVVTVQSASVTNPIVGRIAFWTDDETAKVNINTASEGSYWDVPRIYSEEDFGRNLGGGNVVPGMAVCQPAQKEYQRYAGHPATTSLSPIFGNLLPMTIPITASTAAQLDPYYAIAPRIMGGGSTGGMKMPTGALPPKTERLYASVDELMFTPNLTGKTRIPNTSTGSPSPNLITRGALEKARFFITAHSSAPETTLYNTPRIAIWPVWLNENTRTAYDSLLAFCSTIGGKSYYFTREDARSDTKDYSARNAELYAYLQALTSRDVPGFGGTFLTKYPAGATGITDRDQILTSIYDYIRCTNLSDTSNSAVPYTPLFDCRDVTSESYPVNAGEVVPIKIPALAAGKFTQGFGRVHTVSEADLIIYGTAKTGASTSAMRAVLVFKFSSPMQGLTGMRSSLKFTVTGLDKIQTKVGDAAYASLGLPATGTNYMENADVATVHGRSIGGTEGPVQAMTVNNWNGQKKLTTAGGATRGNYPFFTGQDFSFTPPVAPAAANFKLKGTDDIVVEILSADTNILIQKLQFRFPEGEFKIPGVAGGGATHDFNSRAWQGGGVFRLVNAADTVIGVETAGTLGIAADAADDPTAGDTRILAALPDVPAAAVAGSAPPMFRAHQKYSTVGVQFAHGLHSAFGISFLNAESGKLVNVPAFPKYDGEVARIPSISTRVGNEVKRVDGGPGDWDTGAGDQKDGAYINKPDEGDAAGVDAGGGTRLPYMLGWAREFGPATNTYFSPNRQMPSALMFGSIPTGVQRFKPWQTLLFNPKPEDLTHPGFGTPRVPASGQPFTLPPDHLLADLFWMPVIEPYAISQPFATSGKINMNYQIQPFTYIHRDTGLQAVMKSTKFMALPLSDGPTYKPCDTGAFTNANRRRTIDLAETLKAFETKFANNELFKSATEICDIDLIPPGETKASMATFWNNNKLTGDNLREKPYVDIYPRLTTKSNTYTVHVRVQTLKKVPGTPPDQWVTGRDQVLGEYRGSSLLERYIDLNDPNLPDFAKVFSQTPNDSTLNIDQYYRMRVVSKKRFAP